MSEYTHIGVKPKTKQIIVELKRGNETYNDVIDRLIDNYLAGGIRLPDYAKAAIKRMEEIINE